MFHHAVSLALYQMMLTPPNEAYLLSFDFFFFWLLLLMTMLITAIQQSSQQGHFFNYFERKTSTVGRTLSSLALVSCLQIFNNSLVTNKTTSYTD